MDNNMNDLINNVKNMVNSGNIPPEIQQMMNSMKSSDNNTSSNNSYIYIINRNGKICISRRIFKL